jgi:hypothetical protein
VPEAGKSRSRDAEAVEGAEGSGRMESEEAVARRGAGSRSSERREGGNGGEGGKGGGAVAAFTGRPLLAWSFCTEPLGGSSSSSFLFFFLIFLTGASCNWAGRLTKLVAAQHSPV